MRFRVVPAEPRHIADVADRMRAADRNEVFAARGVTPAEALSFSLQRSTGAYAVEFDGRAEIMFGVGPISLLTGVGAPWLLGTDVIDREFRHFLRASKWWRDQMLARYSTLRNVVDDRNHVSKRWLQWLGFTLSDPFPLGVQKVPFRMFELRAGNV